MKKPSFMIIGAMKSATSTLQDQLVHQDGIYMCTPKEPNFFSDDEQYNKGFEWYANLFSRFPESGLLGEASTHYTKLPDYPDTINRIKKHLSDLKFIYVIRHPIDRLISHYIHEWSMNNYKCDINIAINQYPELINYSLYSMQLKPYIDNFGKENILPVFFDHFIASPQMELENICSFIGYKYQPRWDNSLKAQNISNLRIRRFPLYKQLVESHLATILRRSLVPKPARRYIKNKFRMSEKPSLSTDSIIKLEKIFNDDLAILGGWCNKNLNCKNFKELTKNDFFHWDVKNV